MITLNLGPLRSAHYDWQYLILDENDNIYFTIPTALQGLIYMTGRNLTGGRREHVSPLFLGQKLHPPFEFGAGPAGHDLGELRGAARHIDRTHVFICFTDLCPGLTGGKPAL